MLRFSKQDLPSRFLFTCAAHGGGIDFGLWDGGDGA
jgi:hypothetical protein